MTHAFLKSVAHPPSFAAQLENSYLCFALCYEHKTSSVGHVYESQSLEKFVAEHDIDPIIDPEHFLPPKNIVDILVPEVVNNNIIIINAVHTLRAKDIVRRNYHKYELFGRQELIRSGYFQSKLFEAFFKP